MESPADLLLQPAIEIDKQVAAGDEINSGKWRIAQDVVECKNCDLPKLALDPIMISFPREETPKPLLAYVRFDGCRITPLAGGCERKIVEVGTEHLNSRQEIAVSHLLQQQNPY